MINRILQQSIQICYQLISEMQDKAKYESIHKLINLPKKRKIIPVAESLFAPQKQRSEYITPQIKKSREQLLESIQSQLQIFQQTKYNFVFPASKFPSVPRGGRNNISYQQKVVAEEQDTFKQKLSEEQIQQMKQRGQFEVKSNMKNVKMPYVWKVNDRLLRGRVNIVNIWQHGISWCYSTLFNVYQYVKQDIPIKLKKLTHLPHQFFTLVFGHRSLVSIYKPDYNRQVYKDFWTNIRQNELKDLKDQLGHEFLQEIHLRYEHAINQTVNRPQGMNQYQYKRLCKQRQDKVSYYNERKYRIEQLKRGIINIQSKFQSDWVKVRRRILNKVSGEIQSFPQYRISQNEQDQIKKQKQTKKDQIVIEKFHQEKYKIYSAHLKQHLPKQDLSKQIVQALTSLILIFSILNDRTRIKDEKLKKIEQNISQNICKKYRIRSKYYRFKQKLLKEQLQPIKNQLQLQFYQNLLKGEPIVNLIPERYQSIYKKYIKLQKQFDSLVEQKRKTLTSIYVPERTFKTTYMLLPPYQIVQTHGYYYMIRQRQMNIDTSTNFWKFKLYGMRMKSWTINCAVFLIGFAWVGPLGIRCLYGTQDFKYDEYCDGQTGQRLYMYRKTVISLFRQVYKGVKDSRQYFESLPDRGLFGKKFSRYYNYVECYVFRLFIVGILGVLIIYPILIVVLSALSVVSVLTVWIWVPLIMVVCYLFNILIFQFQCSSRYSGQNITRVPLISLVNKIVSTLVQCIFALLNLIIFSPVVSGLYILFLVVQRGFRTFTDKIMIFLISKLGRTPSRDTAIARKISGPSMSRNYYFSINEEDVYILVQSYLQKTLVQKFVDLTKQIIQSHSKKYNKIMQYVLDPFGLTYPSLRYGRDIINSNQNALMQHFQAQSSYYFARYPNNPRNIRFTEGEIDLYFENSIKIVKNFVQRQAIKDWIFDDYEILYEDYEQLTRKIWVDIFNCGQQIFQPLQRIDSRFKLSQQESSENKIIMRKNIGSVMRALQGEVQLSHRIASANPAKRTLLQKDRTMSYISQICQIHGQNSAVNLNLNLRDPRYIFIAPRNISDCNRYDEYQRQQSKRNRDKFFEEL